MNSSLVDFLLEGFLGVLVDLEVINREKEYWDMYWSSPDLRKYVYLNFHNKDGE